MGKISATVYLRYNPDIRVVNLRETLKNLSQDSLRWVQTCVPTPSWFENRDFMFLELTISHLHLNLPYSLFFSCINFLIRIIFIKS